MKNLLLHMKKASLVLLVVVASLSGCQTMHGMGEDIEDAGEAVQDAADK